MSNPLIEMKDLTDITYPVLASNFSTITAGGNSGTAVTGLTIDRETLLDYGADARGALPAGNLPMGAIFELAYSATLAATKTLSIGTVQVQSSPDGSTWTTNFDQTGSLTTQASEWPAAGVIDTGAAGGSTQKGVVAYGTNLKGCQRYVRFNFTPTLSATSIDVANITVAAVLSGFCEVPPATV
jgi:hypothetical protein